VEVLREFRKFKLKLSPVKCTFKVKYIKLLGFISTEKGIEVDLDKVRAILEILTPHIEKEVCDFLSILNYIARLSPN